MDRSLELAKLVERCPWCGGRVQVILADEPGEMTYIGCAGTPSGDAPCTWSLTGQDAEDALQAASLKRTA